MGYFASGWPKKFHARGGGVRACWRAHEAPDGGGRENASQGNQSRADEAAGDSARNGQDMHPAEQRSRGRLLQVVVDPTGKYLLCVSKHGLYIWSAGSERALLASYEVMPLTSTDQEDPSGPAQKAEVRRVITAGGRAVDHTRHHSSFAAPLLPHDEFVRACWAPEGDMITVACKSGSIFSFRAHEHQNHQEQVSGFAAAMAVSFGRYTSVQDTPADGSKTGAEALIMPESSFALTFLSSAQIGHGASVTSLCSCTKSVLVGLSSSELVLLKLGSLEILWRISMFGVLQEKDTLARLGIYLHSSVLQNNPPLRAALFPTAPTNEFDPGPEANQGSQSEAASGSSLLGAVIDLSYWEALSRVAVVLGCGISLIVTIHEHDVPGEEDLSLGGCVRGESWLRSEGSVSVAIEPSRMSAAVGVDNGDIEIFYVGGPSGDRCPLMRRFSLKGWYFEPQDVGPARHLAWSKQGSALAVGWQKKGMAIWSSSGCRLMWTLPQIGGSTLGGGRGGYSSSSSAGSASSVPSSSQAQEYLMDKGVRSFTWSPFGFSLWAVENGASLCSEPVGVHDQTQRDISEFFFEFSLLRDGITENPCQSEANRFSMLGGDRILLLASSFFKRDARSSQLRVAQRAPQSGAAIERDAGNWQHLLLPTEFNMRGCWPPKVLAISDDGNHVAVAGRCGVAMCHVRSQRWSVFGDSTAPKQHQLVCCAIAWVGKTLVLAVEKAETTYESRGSNKDGIDGGAVVNYELLFFPGGRVDTAQLQARKFLPAKPRLVDVRTDGYLLVVCSHSLMILYRVREQYNGAQLLVQEVYQMSLPTRENIRSASALKLMSKAHLERMEPGGGIVAVRLFPPLDQATYAILAAASAAQGEGVAHVTQPDVIEGLLVPTKVLILRATGSLVLLDVKRMISTPLLRNIEHLWLTCTSNPPFQSVADRPLWWAYGDEGLHVCFQNHHVAVKGTSVSGSDMDIPGSVGAASAAVAAGVTDMTIERWFDLDPEVYPLGLMPEYGFVLGASQAMRFDLAVSPTSQAPPNFTVKLKRQPVLHTLLRHIIMSGRERHALQVAASCTDYPQFMDSLEWLLYESVLEHDNDNSQSGNASTALFPSVLNLLRYFGEYEDVVVRCARKMDPKRWPVLFSYAGEPAAMLEHCFNSDRLYTASCLLVILQEMWGFISSTPHSLRLLEAALNRGEVDLALELSSFLMKADRAGVLNEKQIRIREDVSWVEENSEYWSKAAFHSQRLDSGKSRRLEVVDYYLIRAIRNAISKVKVRDLVAISVKFKIPLAECLQRERYLLAQSFLDVGIVLLKLHVQFEILEPELGDVLKCLTAAGISIDPEGTEKADENNSQSNNGAQGVAASSGPVAAHEQAGHDATANGVVKSAVEHSSGEGAEFSTRQHTNVMNTNPGNVHLHARHNVELEYLENVAELAGASELLLPVSTVLLHVDRVVKCLGQNRSAIQAYVQSVERLNCEGYRALATAFRANFLN
ncbi:RAB6A-GEF complex partner protein 1 [Porphyridium purpureum]|uniref:RAB6A-GEF complex partner protein 1 n=1 Tax=Porphyridium purpureum TaxID=35688 RepID=A0A5J4Z397_PORPP|nr:RAB6A-GEF complex partner protein 1 [Porphyridium purpureum]|eukprot:POR3304..scf295_1